MGVWILMRDALLLLLSPGLSFRCTWNAWLAVLRSVYFDGVEDLLLTLELVHEALMRTDAGDA